MHDILRGTYRYTCQGSVSFHPGLSFLQLHMVCHCAHYCFQRLSVCYDSVIYCLTTVNCLTILPGSPVITANLSLLLFLPYIKFHRNTRVHSPSMVCVHASWDSRLLFKSLVISECVLYTINSYWIYWALALEFWWHKSAQGKREFHVRWVRLPNNKAFLVKRSNGVYAAIQMLPVWLLQSSCSHGRTWW